MKRLITSGLVLGLALASGSLAFAGPSGRSLLSPMEARAYRACLFEAWIQEYCGGNSMRPTSTAGRVYTTCVLANGGGRFPMEGRTYANTDDFCWYAAQHVVRY
jgi:hypothetical protein